MCLYGYFHFNGTRPIIAWPIQQQSQLSRTRSLRCLEHGWSTAGARLHSATATTAATSKETEEGNKSAIKFTQRPLTGDKPTDRQTIWHHRRRSIPCAWPSSRAGNILQPKSIVIKARLDHSRESCTP